MGWWMRYIPIEGLRWVGGCGIFLLRDCDGLLDAYIPIEGLRWVGGCGIFLLRGCDGLVDA
eukprot:247725-Prorocentrum_minimum.AAC.1